MQLLVISPSIGRGKGDVSVDSENGNDKKPRVAEFRRLSFSKRIHGVFTRLVADWLVDLYVSGRIRAIRG